MPARQASPPPERPSEAKTSPTAAGTVVVTIAESSFSMVTTAEADNATTTSDIYQHSNYVYILDPKHSWIPAQITNRTKSGDNDAQQIIHVSVPQYKSEQAIQCDGGRTAKSFEKMEINLTDPKTMAMYPSQHLPLQNVNNEGELQVVEDMVDLPFLHEAAILYNIKARHVESLPCTRTGDIILACNPYQWFHDLYSEQVRNHYSQALVWNARQSSSDDVSPITPIRKSHRSYAATPAKTSGTSNDPRTALAPHVYETSCLAYKGLLRDKEDQSILVSGESGAGKTETVKILLRNLADIQEGGRKKSTVGMPTSSSPDFPQDNVIVQRVLDSNPLLEAFGNATTLRNDNSSRFGKYLQLQFDTTYSSSTLSSPAILAGSKCEVYLLEKSRVTHHHISERTYHIFYQLLAAPEELKVAIWDGLADTDVESFCYVGLTESDSPSATQGIIEGKTDAERFQLTLQALELIGVQGEILQMLLRAICVVLQLGNLEFSPAQPSDAKSMLALGIHHRTGGSGGDDGEHHDASVISSVEELQELSELLGMSDIDQSDDKISNALRTALTVRNVEARGEIFAVPLTPEKAKESADAFAKEIYAKTFLWLVRTINDATCAEKNYHSMTSSPKTTTRQSLSPPTEYGIIGLLDIFGFETFEVNRFEQLCINYCNEKLQQKFTQDIFRSVQVEYENEGIELEEITYDDNTDVLDLVEGRMGLLAFLNEECVRPKGSDKTFVYKAQAMNKDNPCFFRDKHAQDTEFGICHYAGKVVYDATNFVVKNTDTLPSDLLDCAKLSSNAIISKELTNDSMMNPLHINSVTSASTAGKKKKRPKPTQSSSHPHTLQKRTSNIIAETVWTKFRNQLSRLMETLSETKTRYIRCIKPNSHKAPLIMEHTSTIEQLRCAGVVAAVTISRSAFPNRLEHLSVLDRFKSLWPKGDHITVLADRDLDPEERRRKATAIFLTLALKELEFEKNGSNFRAFVMGKTRAYFRAGALEFLEAERLKHLGTYATVLQTSVRGFIIRSKYKKHRHAVITLEARYRRILQRRIYVRMRIAAIRVQCWYRLMFAARAVYHLRRMVRATTIQTRWRIYRDTRRLKNAVAASIVVQAMVRGSLQRPKYVQALIDKKEEAKLENQLRTLQKKLEEAEAKRVDAEKQAEEQAKAAIEQYKEKEASARDAKTTEDHNEEEEVVETSPSNETSGQAVQEFTAEQQRLMDESGKMLESLRKEVFKLRSQNQQLRTDFDLLKDNNQRLMDANASAGASFAALNQHAKQLSKQNAILVSEVQNLKGHIHKLNIQQVELKDELRFKNATYVAEVQSRLNFQKALQKITDMISESCRDHRLVERVLTVADEVEMNFMAASGEDSVENSPGDTMENTGNSSRGGILGYFFS
ncbi:myosin G [Nitzschia inconspicua]|uniref:Myosin G n=1 Tax=Nitzschia inconspicua TaxID=303405 RepID=A0A9K3Q1Y0_9STRA|nr:myosin G [Nitzschia inconspicua]